MAKRPNNNWTREEHILAFNLYCQIPFGSIDMRNPRVIELAGLLGRTKGSGSRKLSNLPRLDPALQARGIRGLAHGPKGQEKVFPEVMPHPQSLSLYSQQFRANSLRTTSDQV